MRTSRLSSAACTSRTSGGEVGVFHIVGGFSRRFAGEVAAQAIEEAGGLLGGGVEGFAAAGKEEHGDKNDRDRAGHAVPLMLRGRGRGFYDSVKQPV